MRKVFFLLWILLPVFIFGQNWLQFADLNHQDARRFYVDPIDNVLYIGGHFRYVNDTVDARGIVRWNGVQFEALGMFPNSQCNSFNCDPVLSIVRYDNEIYCTLINGWWFPGEIRGIARWDGISWDSLEGGVHGLVIEQIVYQGELFVMGRFDQAGLDTVNSVAKWDGQGWHSVDFPYTIFEGGGGITINAATIYNDELYVAGNFWNESETVRDVAKYDGSQWHPVGNGIKGFADDVSDIIVYKDEIYVCGTFNKASGNAGNKIMMLKDDEWVDVGGSFDNSFALPSCMAVFNDKLCVFGIFESVGGGIPTENIAVWDGEKWCGTGSSINGKIGDGVVYEGALFIEGGFDIIDGEEVRDMAMWIGAEFIDTCGMVISTKKQSPKKSPQILISPNPSQEYIHIISKLHSFTSGTAEITLFNTSGAVFFQKEVILQDGSINEKVEIHSCTPGSYIIQIQFTEGLWTKKVVIH